jgi:hypothetical protein
VGSALVRDYPYILWTKKLDLTSLTGFPYIFSPAMLAGNNPIFLKKDQIRKTPPADITRHRQGGHTKEGYCAMNACHLRVYHGPQEETEKVGVTETRRDTVTVPLMDVLPLLADAMQSQRTWVRDFSDDEITISMDLYEVLLAYQHYRRPSA